MKTAISALLALAVFGLAQHTTPYIDPSTGAQRIYDVPFGTRYGITLNTDTLHVTTSEKGWSLGSGCIGFMLINRNDATYTLRFSNVSGIVPITIGTYSTLSVYPPGAIKDDNGIDSLFIDGSSAVTLDLIYWVAQ